MRLSHLLLMMLLLLLLLAAPFSYAQQRLNIEMLKKDTQIFEGIVAQVLKQNFTNPFALEGAPMGAYLQGYGVVISFHLNINRDTIRTPWGEIDAAVTRGGKRPKKEDKILQVRNTMVQCLADYGSTLKQLTAHDRISINAHIKDRNQLDARKKLTVIVLTASKDDIDLFTIEKIDLDTFKERLHVLQY